MRKLHVDLDQAVGDVVFTQLHGEMFSVGDHVAVYDLDTDTYEAVVQTPASADAVALLVDFTKVLEAT